MSVRVGKNMSNNIKYYLSESIKLKGFENSFSTNSGTKKLNYRLAVFVNKL